MLATVLSDADHQTVIVTEYDHRGFIIYAFEWQANGAHPRDREGVVTLTITDWDQQIIERRAAHRLPPPPADQGGLTGLLRPTG